jgi:hypothetical protein
MTREDINKAAQWMIDRSYATGHGETIEDLLKELEWQVAERERKSCAQVCEKIADDYDGSPAGTGADNCATAIRGRK